MEKDMGTIAKSALEVAVLDRFHQLYQAKGFPSSDMIGVARRENTGGGRYVDLTCDRAVRLDDGYVDLGGGFVHMAGLPNGMMAVVRISGGRLRTLEFTVYGGDHWDGSEREWNIV
jgi:hypothetical protein